MAQVEATRRSGSAVNSADQVWADPGQVRQACRDGRLVGPTAGQAPGHVQGNLVILPRSLAFEFLLFCQRNPKPCPVIDVTEPGDPEPRLVAPGADLRFDLPRYRIFRDGVLAGEAIDVSDLWRSDSVGFLIGCSFTFEQAMASSGLPVRHVECGRNVPMYLTDIPLVPAGPFHGRMVVSMRPLNPADAVRAVQVTGRFPRAHGAPVHIGDPAAIGIGDIGKPDYGDPPELRAGEVPVFWACGVTPQAVMLEAKPALAITHAPGHMFVADIRDSDLEG